MGRRHSPTTPDQVSSTSNQSPDIICGTIDAENTALRELNLKIHANPELCFEEHQAHDNIVEFLEKRNFRVKKHTYGLQTSFEAEVGSGGRLLVFNAEYDALPGIGHACGHNLIATSSVAAFLGVAAALDRAGIPGRVRLLGTPAEEGGGGKALLIERGAYEGVDASMMLHPAPPHSNPKASGSAFVTTTAASSLQISFTGHPAHAGIAPHEGKNALDAVVLGYNGVSMLRQQTMPYDRIHGIITKGGDANNIIPADTALEFAVRSHTRAEVHRLQDRVLKCFEGAAMATDCKIQHETKMDYAELRPNRVLCELYTDAMRTLGSLVINDDSERIAASTDMGNVTHICPGFHAMFGIPCQPGGGNHTPAFTAVAGSEEAHRLTIDAAKGMAIAGWRVLESQDVAEKVWRAFTADRDGGVGAAPKL